jgi:hypothetical protein
MPATWKVEMENLIQGQPQAKVRNYMKNKLKQKRLRIGFT